MNILGKNERSVATLGIDENGGLVRGYGKDGKVVALGIGENGGHVYIVNKAGQIVGQFGVSDRGGGILTTKDKHGYKTGRVP